MRTSLFLFTSLAFAAALHAQEYNITLHRPYQKGDQCTFDEKVQRTQSQQVDVNGKPAQQKELSVEASLKGNLEVVEVNKNGQMTKIKFTVDQWHMQADGKDNTDLKKGDTVEGEGGKPGQFKVNGAPVSAEVASALPIFFDLKTDDSPPETDDAVMGPGKKVKVGESWNINTEAAAKDLSEKFGSPVKADMIKGTAKLESVDGAAPAQTLKVSGEIDVNVAGVEIPGAPGMVAQKFSITVKLTGNFPIDPTLPETGGAEEFTTEVEASNGTAAPTQVKVASKDHTTKTAKMEWKRGH